MAGVCPADTPRSPPKVCLSVLLCVRERRGVRESERGGRRPRGKSINWRSERTRASTSIKSAVGAWRMHRCDASCCGQCMRFGRARTSINSRFLWTEMDLPPEGPHEETPRSYTSPVDSRGPRAIGDRPDGMRLAGGEAELPFSAHS